MGAGRETANGCLSAPGSLSFATMRRIGSIVADYAYVGRSRLRYWRYGSRPPAPIDAAPDAPPPVLLIPGVFETWHYLKPIRDRLAALGGRMIVEALELAACGGLKAVPQPAEGITYAHKIEKAESTIDWSLPATVIGQRIRAFDPFPGASTECAGETIKVWSYEIDSCSRLSDKRWRPF